MAEPFPAIRRTSELVSAACREQSIGIEQVDQSVVQLDRVAQANAGAVKEMTAAAEALSGESVPLNERSTFFRLEAAVRADMPSGCEAPSRRRPSDSRPAAPRRPRGRRLPGA